MGQYYKPTILKEDYKNEKQPIVCYAYTWDFNNGLKLMEHSYVGNHVTRQMEKELATEHYGKRLVWAGDYADENENWKDNDGYLLNVFALSGFLEEQGENLKIEPDDYDELKSYRYAVNLDKKEYVKIPRRRKGKLTIHPLPLLCADGNGRGGGDFHCETAEHLRAVGSWAYDRIGVTNKKPDGFTEIVPDFKEDR